MKTKDASTAKTNRNSVENAVRTVIYSLRKAGFKQQEAQDVLHGLYHGQSWNEFDMAVALCEAYREVK